MVLFANCFVLIFFLWLHNRHQTVLNVMNLFNRNDRNRERPLSSVAAPSSPSSASRPSCTYALPYCADADMRAFIQAHSARVPFVRQSQSWDCGLACALMVLGALGNEVS